MAAVWLPNFLDVYLHSIRTVNNKAECSASCELCEAHRSIVGWSTSVLLRHLVIDCYKKVTGCTSELISVGEMTNEQSLRVLTDVPHVSYAIDDDAAAYDKLGDERIADMCSAFVGLNVNDAAGLLLTPEYGHVCPKLPIANSNFQTLVTLHNAVMDANVCTNVLSLLDVEQNANTSPAVCAYNYLSFHLNGVMDIGPDVITFMWTSNVLVKCLTTTLKYYPRSYAIAPLSVGDNSVPDLRRFTGQ